MPAGRRYYKSTCDCGGLAVFHTGFLGSGLFGPGALLEREDDVDINHLRPAANQWRSGPGCSRPTGAPMRKPQASCALPPMIRISSRTRGYLKVMDFHKRLCEALKLPAEIRGKIDRANALALLKV